MVRAPRAPHDGPLMLRVAAEKQWGSFHLNVRFELRTPGVVALFGPSGCGKSTTINLIAGLVEADRGEVTLDDTVLLDTRRNVHVSAERRRIGYVFQDSRLFPHLSVAANLRYAQKRAIGTPYVSMEAVTDMLGLAPLMQRRTHRLSGGERQRVAIGRALLTQPRLLLLDEPLASLDRELREELLPYLESLRDQLAIPMVYVSHDFDEVLRLATHIVLMESGAVIGQGSIGKMSLDRRLRALIGPQAVGAIIDGEVLGEDAASGMSRVRVGNGELKVQTCGMAAGATVRVQLLARDIIVSTQMPQHLSVRNNLRGVITAVTGDDAHTDLIAIDIGGTDVLARVTKAATRELALEPGMAAWALVKSVSLRAIPFANPRT
jgi:molybdate transport system ATP-binding protein